MGGSHEMPCEPFLSSYLVSLSDCQLEWSPGVLPGAVCCVRGITVSAQGSVCRSAPRRASILYAR